MSCISIRILGVHGPWPHAGGEGTAITPSPEVAAPVITEVTLTTAVSGVLGPYLATGSGRALFLREGDGQA